MGAVAIVELDSDVEKLECRSIEEVKLSPIYRSNSKFGERVET